MIIVETKPEFEELFSNLRGYDCVIDVVLSDSKRHALNNTPSLIIVFFPTLKNLFVVPILHNEGLVSENVVLRFKEEMRIGLSSKFVFDKKKVVQVFDEDFQFIDLNVIKYLESGNIETFVDINNNASVFITSMFRNYHNLNRAIPIAKHCDLFFQKLEKFQIPVNGSFSDKSFDFLNNIAINRFAQLESIGIGIDKPTLSLQFGEEQLQNTKDGLIFSQYNLFTSTGRPSNRFGGINFAAMNKTDGSREPIISRYGIDGMLVMVDYSAFHPRLIAKLSNYPLDFDTNPYEYLAKYFFKKKNVSDAEIGEAKGYTFQQFYGGIQPRFAKIPYFKKAQEYIDHRWSYFKENGFVETPIYFRKIKECHIEDPSPNKLFNYILQAYETEVAVLTLGRILDHLKGRATQPVLYTYDSLLFDAHRQDGQETIRQIRDIMVDKTFPVKVYVGKSYADMAKIEIR